MILGLAGAAPKARLRDAIAVFALGLPMLGIMVAPLLAVLALIRALA